MGVHQLRRDAGDVRPDGSQSAESRPPDEIEIDRLDAPGPKRCRGRVAISLLQASDRQLYRRTRSRQREAAPQRPAAAVHEVADQGENPDRVGWLGPPTFVGSPSAPFPTAATTATGRAASPRGGAAPVGGLS